MIFVISIRAATLAAAALIAGAAAATPYQALRADAGPVHADVRNCSRATIDEACDTVAALLDTATAGQVQPAALYQDLLTPLEDGNDAEGHSSAEAGNQPAATTAPAAAQAPIPVPEQRPYTMLLVGLGLLVFKSRKKRTEKFSA